MASSSFASSSSRRFMESIRRLTIRTLVGSGVLVGGLEITTHLPSEGRSSQFYHDLTDKVVVPMMRRWFNPETAHKVALQVSEPFAPTFRPSIKEQQVDVSVKLWQQGDSSGDSSSTTRSDDGVLFSNPIGLAAGYDKDATAMTPLLQMGFGFVEIGSVCLRPQPGNHTPRMFRLPNDNAIINRYGFNSGGADVVENHLQEFRNMQQQLQRKENDQTQETTPTTLTSIWERFYDLVWPGQNLPIEHGIIGVNLGKNKTSTTPVEDYQMLIEKLGPYADYLVINVSSPNTPGLRDLQESSSLETLLVGCQEAIRNLPLTTTKTTNGSSQSRPSRPPLLVKLAPDLSNDDLKELASLFLKLKIDGIILTNTTIARPDNLMTPGDVKQETGGLSGRPLKQRSTEVIRLLYESTRGTIPIIGVGGVENGHDAYEKFKAGASLVQVYSSLIYEGPGLVSRIRNEVATLMVENGQRNLQQDVVGSDHEELFWNKQREAVQLRQNTETPTVVIDS